MRAAAVITGGAILLCAGCEQFLGVNDAAIAVSAPESGTSDSGPEDAPDTEVEVEPDTPDGTDAPGGDCPSGFGPAMRRVPAGFCIDTTEVTQSQYKTWLDSSPSQSPECAAWNLTFQPSCDWDPDSRGQHPVVCVDWCDADAFCSAAGKQLCGARAGGNVDDTFQADPAVSQWYYVCSADGTQQYSNGDYDAQACNVRENLETGCQGGICDTRPAGSMTTCQSSTPGFEGIYDLTGNVQEWENGCETWNPDHAGTACWIRGGSFLIEKNPTACGVVDHPYRKLHNNDRGFRCCAP